MPLASPAAPPVVRRARAGEEKAIAGALTAAFPDEPALNWWLKQDVDKERARAKFFEAAMGDAVHPKRELWLAEAGEGGRVMGGALWCPPGATAFELPLIKQLRVTPLLLSIAGFEGMERALALGKELVKSHPKPPHWHLVFLGVIPELQGQGVGSAMLKQMLRGVDEANAISYLEASVERSVGLYQRHGFDITQEFFAPQGGPKIWTMTRPAQV
jgi:ribosomal protein S18 acetylase RimI-like enzyme